MSEWRPKPRVRWTPEEKAVINKAVLDGTKARHIEALLPGRNRTQIQCQLASARKRLRDGRGVWKDPEADRRDQNAVMAQGVCRWCRKRMANYTLISCESCATTRNIAKEMPELEISKAKADILPWIYSRQPGQLVSWLPRGKKVVDVFGGSGRISRAAVRLGKRVVFNDIHPLLSPYIRALAKMEHAAINLVAADLAIDPAAFPEHYRRTFFDPPDDVMAAATVRVAAFNSRCCRLNEVKTVSFAPHLTFDRDSRLWQKMATETRDWKEVILDHDSLATSFILDPPYPKTAYFEHNFQWADLKNLVETIAGIRGKFLMALPLRRNIVELCHRHELLSWMRRGRVLRNGRDLIVANYQLNDPDLEPIEPARYGLERDDQQKEMVEDIVEALQKLGGVATRDQIGEHIGHDGPEVLGAISRARADGRIQKYDRRRYSIPDTRDAVTTSDPEPDEFDLVLDALEEGALVPASEDFPFLIYMDLDKVVGPVDDFVKSLNQMGYEVRFRDERS